MAGPLIGVVGMTGRKSGQWHCGFSRKPTGDSQHVSGPKCTSALYLSIRFAKGQAFNGYETQWLKLSLNVNANCHLHSFNQGVSMKQHS